MNFSDLFKKSALESFSSSSGVTLDFILGAVIALAVALGIGIAIYKLYGYFYGGVVYNSSFAVSLIGMTVLTCMLTLAISSNIVISLGMVGALSIVRYRTAIKDPMDLLYLFWAIAMGITVAAKLYVLAALGMGVMCFVVWFFYKKRKSGVIYILVVHFKKDSAEDEIYRCLGNVHFQVKSLTVREGFSELTVQLMTTRQGTNFVSHIKVIDGVKDVSLIQYNGEYNG